MDLHYREGTLADAKQLQGLGLISYGQFQPVLGEENWNKLRSFFINDNSFPNLIQKSKCFVCEVEGQIVGMAYLISKGNPTDIFQFDWSYVRMVGVHPDFGSNGIGKRLMEMCIDYAAQTGEKTIALHTSEFMDAARHIYEKLGFVKTKELEPRYGKRYWLYLLKVE